MARNPNTTWEMLNNAMAHYQEYISSKSQRNLLTVVDLLHVSNFKGGNASITEPVGALDQKLMSHEKILGEIEKLYGRKTLASLNEEETEALIILCSRVLETTKDKKTKIRGFGPSYASALLAAHFMELIPVLDRRILNGAETKVEYNSQKQVKNIAQYYGSLIKACQNELQKRNNITLRQLDKEWFAKAL